MAKEPTPPNEVDAHIGRRLREKRIERELTLADLATAVGHDMTADLVDKYEKGSVRFSAPILTAFARALNERPKYFYEGSPPRPPGKTLH